MATLQTQQLICAYKPVLKDLLHILQQRNVWISVQMGLSSVVVPISVNKIVQMVNSKMWQQKHVWPNARLVPTLMQF